MADGNLLSAFEGGVWVGAAVEAEGIVLQLVTEGAKGLV